MFLHQKGFRVVLVQVVWGLPGERYRRIVECDRVGATAGELLDIACGGIKEVHQWDSTGLEQAALRARTEEATKVRRLLRKSSLRLTHAAIMD